jgi:tetratricopeptide (TPR) repeat protein
LLEAIAKFRQSLRYDPGYHYAWANLGVVYRWMERYDSAITCLRIADGLNPYSFSTYMKLGGTYHGAGDFEQAEKYWKRAVILKKDDLECRAFLLSLYKDQGRLAEYETMLAEIIVREGTPPEFLIDAARNELERNQPDSARQLLVRALGVGLDSATTKDLQDEFRELWPLDADTASTVN